MCSIYTLMCVHTNTLFEFFFRQCGGDAQATSAHASYTRTKEELAGAYNKTYIAILLLYLTTTVDRISSLAVKRTSYTL